MEQPKVDLPPPHLFASGSDINRILRALFLLDAKVDMLLGTARKLTEQEKKQLDDIATIKQDVADLTAEVAQERDGKVAVQKAFAGLIDKISTLTSELKAATANAGNPQDLTDIGAGLTAVLSAVHENRLADAAIANTELDPNAGNPNQPAPAPSVSSISPVSGSAAGGDTVTISGAGFTGATGVNFGAAAAASFTIVDDTTITAVTPASTAGISVAVSVTGPTGTSAETPQFAFA